MQMNVVVFVMVLATSDGKLMVAAIDFGTTYSGWAFSFYHEFKLEPCKASTETTNGQKASPTCVLINPDGKTLDTFGVDAEMRYSQLSQSGEHKKWFFFQKFKMMLWNKAGITSEKFTIALEPEVASFYCRHIPVQFDATACGISCLKSGSKYLVLDAGGGTIDIAVHEICFGGKLKEIYKATGGAWGGTMVDKAFLDFLADLIGEDVLQRFKDDHMEDYIGLLRDFEIKKRATYSSSEGLVTIKLPLVLIEFVEENNGLSMKKIVESSRYANKVSLSSDKFRLDISIFRSFFTKSINAIVEHLQTLLRQGEPSKAEAILMVGGYSESLLLVETIREKFPRLKIIVPTDAGLAVLKGAVIFGHSPTSISERVSKYTYGIKCTKPFNKHIHPLDKLSTTDNGNLCKDIFDIFVSSDQTLVVGEKHAEKRFVAVNSNQTSMDAKIYITTNKAVQYVTDEGCREVGSLIIPLSGSGTGRVVIIRLYFGGTEIKVEAEEEATGRITSTVVNFLL